MNNLDRVKDIYKQLSEGKALDAFEQYYADEVVMIEGDGKVREGKEVNRQAEIDFFSNISEIHGAAVDSFAYDEENEITMVENWMEVTFKDGNRMKLEQIARQKWQGGKVIEERFYYNA